jgi:hypothetical protein
VADYAWVDCCGARATLSVLRKGGPLAVGCRTHCRGPSLSCSDPICGWGVRTRRNPAPFGSMGGQILFPISGLVASNMEMPNGEAAETALIGREGTSGMLVWLGPVPCSTTAIARVAGMLRESRPHRSTPRFGEAARSGRWYRRLPGRFWRNSSTWQAATCCTL